MQSLIRAPNRSGELVSHTHIQHILPLSDIRKAKHMWVKKKSILDVAIFNHKAFYTMPSNLDHEVYISDNANPHLKCSISQVTFSSTQPTG